MAKWTRDISTSFSARIEHSVGRMRWQRSSCDGSSEVRRSPLRHRRARRRRLALTTAPVDERRRRKARFVRFSFVGSICERRRCCARQLCKLSLRAFRYPEDFYDVEGEKFALLAAIVDFARRNELADLKHRARKLRERHRRLAADGGLAAQLPALSHFVYTLDYDPNDLLYAQERAQMFDISRDNCVSSSDVSRRYESSEKMLFAGANC